MSENKYNLDYKKLGLKCGLEIHQQLNTDKLFCRCKSKLINEDLKPDKIISRKLRAVFSETGSFDLTAKEEENKKKTFKYYFYNDCNCLVETDSQPPFNINLDSLKISLVISYLTNSNILDQSFVMRKQVIDGSNVSGFQKTVMISTDGFLDFDFGQVRIDKILLEEDAARVLKREKDEIIYSLDRLGIPLIELVVWHDMTNPNQVKQVAKHIGSLFRSTGKTKRGLGSIRQDINISISQGNRVEIKGCQDLEMIPEIIDREILRQINLIEIKNDLLTKGINSFNLDFKNINDYFKNSTSKIILNSFKEGKNGYLFILPSFKGFLGREIQPSRRLGSELASVLKKRTSLKGLFHLDELPNYGIEKEDVLKIKKDFKIGDDDSFIIVFSDKEEISSVKMVLEKRLNQLFEGVLKETRVVNIDMNTEYQRMLSTSSRMYPETDLEPIVFSKELLDSAKKEIPLSLYERKKLYSERFNINKQLIDKMALNNFAPVFEKLVLDYKINPTFLAVFLLEDIINASREKKINLDDVLEEKIFSFFSYENILDKIPKNKVLDVFIDYINETDLIENLIEKNKKQDFQENEIILIVKKIILQNKEFIEKQKERSIGFVMGKTMSETKNKFDGEIISQIVKNEIDLFLNSKTNI